VGEICFDVREVSHTSSDKPGPVFAGRELKVAFHEASNFFCNCSRLVAEVRIIGGGLPAWLGDSYSSPPVSSRSIAAGSGAKKLSSRGWALASGLGIIGPALDFFACVAWSSEGFFYRLRCSRNSLSALIPPRPLGPTFPPFCGGWPSRAWGLLWSRFSPQGACTVLFSPFPPLWWAPSRRRRCHS
jgi:hypothetical protein